MKDEIKRRDLLKGAGALSTGALAGCSYVPFFSDDQPPEINDQANRTEQTLKNQLPWDSYSLDYKTGSINLSTSKVGNTGVEGASQYRLKTKIGLAGNSDDLDGWMGTQERQSEFFNLIGNTVYDMLSQVTEDFSEFEPGQRPSSRNQVVEYRIKVNAEDCSYVKDTMPADRMDDILSSRSSYAEYVDGGAQYEINIEDGLFGTDWGC